LLVLPQAPAATCVALAILAQARARIRACGLSADSAGARLYQNWRACGFSAEDAVLQWLFFPG
jgi:hypothetical protein